MRLFLAIELNQPMKQALSSMQLAMKQNGVRGNYTKQENLHLTLAFIGEYPDPETVLTVLNTVPFSPFILELEGFGAFGSLYWVGLKQNDALSVYVSRLRRALAIHEIPYDHKKFRPHITLVRQATWDSRRGMPGIQVPSASMLVDHVSLMRSDRGKHGMIYTPIGGTQATRSG